MRMKSSGGVLLNPAVGRIKVVHRARRFVRALGVVERYRRKAGFYSFELILAFAGFIMNSINSNNERFPL